MLNCVSGWEYALPPCSHLKSCNLNSQKSYLKITICFVHYVILGLRTVSQNWNFKAQERLVQKGEQCMVRISLSYVRTTPATEHVLMLLLTLYSTCKSVLLMTPEPHIELSIILSGCKFDSLPTEETLAHLLWPDLHATTALIGPKSETVASVQNWCK